MGYRGGADRPLWVFRGRKSMTLQMIAGLMKPDQGSIRLGGQVLFDSRAGIDVPPQDRSIGYLFQDLALFPHMTVGAISSTGRRGWGKRKDGKKQRR